MYWLAQYWSYSEILLIFIAEYDGLLNVYDFEPGWSFIDREKDMSNYEWYFFYNLFWIIIPWYIAYISLDWIAAHHLSVIHRRQTCLIYSLIVLTHLLGWKSLVLLCVHSVVMYLISLFKFPNEDKQNISLQIKQVKIELNNQLLFLFLLKTLFQFLFY
ncbi:unnamed protein product [Mytilus edulis]|uniref:Uncharacterized protein n=1 Tax=Mytilus edulis TaxID=6550 RepID=A0A8S3V880_MYTED|nr:unnamed protein product [Mytilus edulis]